MFKSGDPRLQIAGLHVPSVPAFVHRPRISLSVDSCRSPAVSSLNAVQLMTAQIATDLAAGGQWCEWCL